MKLIHELSLGLDTKTNVLPNWHIFVRRVTGYHPPTPINPLHRESTRSSEFGGAKLISHLSMTGCSAGKLHSPKCALSVALL